VTARRQVWVAAVGCVVILAVVLSLASMWYATGRLDALRGEPGYESAERAMREMLLRDCPGGTVEIVGSGTDGPGLRYVVGRVRSAAATEGADGKPREIGTYFLRMERGWVHLPADEFSGPAAAVGKALLECLPHEAP